MVVLPRRDQLPNLGSKATGGSAAARDGIRAVLHSLGVAETWRRSSAVYRKLVYCTGEASGLSENGKPMKPGFSPEAVQKVLDKGGNLSHAQLLHCRVRYFSDGVVLGSKAFVNSVFAEHREQFGVKRKDGARKLKHGAWSGLCTMRDLRLAPISITT